MAIKVSFMLFLSLSARGLPVIMCKSHHSMTAITLAVDVGFMYCEGRGYFLCFIDAPV